MEIPFLSASQLGLRASEIAGLQYECINYDSHEIVIKQSKVTSENGPVLKAPKTYSGYRTLPCSKAIINIIGRNEDSRAFLINFSTNSISERWKRVIVKAQIPHFNFHALRHYFASQALLQGVPQNTLPSLWDTPLNVC